VATSGTGAFLSENGITCELTKKVYEGRPNVVDLMKDGGIQLVMNTTDGNAAVSDSRDIRSVALYDKIPYFTTAAGAHAAAMAMKEREEGDLEIKSLQG
jgi:carbamoyl-phosphate synthase large subunit